MEDRAREAVGTLLGAGQVRVCKPPALQMFWLSSVSPDALMAAIAGFLAEYVVWMILATVGIGYLRASDRARKVLPGGRRVRIDRLAHQSSIGPAEHHPRPFMIGLEHLLIPDAGAPG